MKSKLSALAISALLAACSAVPHHNEQTKVLLDEGIALYQKQDYQHAMPYFEQAQQAGHMKALRYLGLMYLNGEGVAQNAQTAFAYFTQAAPPRKTPLKTAPPPKAHKILLGTSNTAARINPTTAACSPCASKSPRVLKC
jgi:tetratricopeptide repeat protein|nr:hypothetical protein [uncultured Neisseria sp.]